MNEWGMYRRGEAMDKNDAVKHYEETLRMLNESMELDLV